MPSGQIAVFKWAFAQVHLDILECFAARAGTKTDCAVGKVDEYEYSYVRLDIDRKAIAKIQPLAFISTGLTDSSWRTLQFLTTLIGSRLKNVTKSHFSPKAALFSLEQPWLGCSSKRWKFYLQLFFHRISCNRERQESLSVSSCMLNLTIGMQKHHEALLRRRKKRVEMAMKGESAIGDASTSASTTRNFQSIAQPPETRLDERCTHSRCVQGHSCFLLWRADEIISSVLRLISLPLPAGSLKSV